MTYWTVKNTLAILNVDIVINYEIYFLQELRFATLLWIEIQQNRRLDLDLHLFIYMEIAY